MTLAQTEPPVSPTLNAALLLAARELQRQLNLPCPSVAQVLEATGAGRSRAYELASNLKSFLPTLVRPVGRPAAATSEAPVDELSRDRLRQLTLAILRFVASHPGSLSARDQRAHYSDAFREYVVELRQEYSELAVEAFAQAIDVPLGTVKDWLSGRLKNNDKQGSTEAGPRQRATSESSEVELSNAHFQTILVEWEHWGGSFRDFFQHLQHDCRIPFGRSLITSILETEGVRRPARRPGRPPDEEALRGTFETFFPGAQWVGDGSSINIVIDGTSMTTNLELMVDAYSGAFVGVSVRDNEDSAAVVEAYESGIQTSGEPPTSVLLDNRASNHTPEVDKGLGADTLRIRSTPGRGQSKAHVEGAFGLFSQTMPELVFSTESGQELAKQIVLVMYTLLMRAMNHRPRRNRDGRSRKDLYGDKPSKEQITKARNALLERMRQQELAQQTILARLDPLLRALLDEAFAELALADPERYFRARLARYGHDAIVEGIAVFHAKREAGTLPPDVDARYLLGIVRNVATDNELHELTESLIRERLLARDLALSSLEEQRCTAEELHADSNERIAHHVDCAATAERNIDRVFWTSATADIIIAEAGDSIEARTELLRYACARTNLTSALPHQQRSAILRALARTVLPVT